MIITFVILTYPDPATAAANPRVENPNYDANKEGTKTIKLAIPLKYLGNFWRASNMPLISCEVSLKFKWNKNCIITSLRKDKLEQGLGIMHQQVHH